MKTICIIIEIIILFTVMFQTAVLDSKSLSDNKNNMFYHDQSLFRRVLSSSVWNKSHKLTEKVSHTNIFGANHYDNLNYTNATGI